MAYVVSLNEVAVISIYKTYSLYGTHYVLSASDRF